MEEAITGTSILLDFLGGVALLLWGLRMVRTGATRAFGAGLRRALARSTASRLHAFAIGLGVTVLLQSSTATALMASSFVSRSMIAVGGGLAIMLGADVGTSLVAQALSWQVHGLHSLLLFVGVATFLSSKATVRRDIGRLLIGVGLMLLSIRLIVGASEPLRSAVPLHHLFDALAGEHLIALLFAAGLTWLAHSSLAIVLLIMSLTGAGAVPLELGFALVLGANVGGTAPAVLASLPGAAEARRVTFGNALFKLLGALAVLPFLELAVPYMAKIEADPARQIINFHTAFNLAVGLFFLPFVGLAARLWERILPAKPADNDPARPRYLDPSSIETPSVALTCAARETLHMGDVVEHMLRDSMKALLTDDRRLIAEIERMDDVVDRLHEAIKLYVTEVTRGGLDETEGRRATDILAFTTNLEHIGDIIDNNLMELAAKKVKGKRRFSDQGTAELVALHRQVLDNLKLALGVFISGDVKIARRLLDEKVQVREAERMAAENHLARLREGRTESIDSSSLHLDVLRDLKRIHSHICSVAYPVLDAAGELRSSRLISREHEDDTLAPTPSLIHGAEPGN